MEDSNIPYRKLRQQKNKTSIKTADLKIRRAPSESKVTKRQRKQRQFSIMSQNVTQYEHLLRQTHMKSDFVEWMVKLRQPITFSQRNKDDERDQTPAVYNQSTKSRQSLLKSKKVSSVKAFNSANFPQFMSRKQNCQHVDPNLLGFMASLRSEPQQNNKAKHKFCNLPHKDRKQYPTFLAKNAIKKLRDINKNERESAFDGSQGYPAYSPKLIPEKNYNIVSAFSSNSKNRLSLPSLAWQLGLRD